MWTYMAYGPWPDEASMRGWLDPLPASEDPLFLTVIDRRERGTRRHRDVHERRPGHAAPGAGQHLVRAARPAHARQHRVGVPDVAARRSTLGNRRVEWKCDALNARSREAAERLGFTFEGVFRQHMIIKGRNRDTAWYAMLDHEWPALRANFERWLDEDPPPSLRELNAALRP